MATSNTTTIYHHASPPPPPPPPQPLSSSSSSSSPTTRTTMPNHKSHYRMAPPIPSQQHQRNRQNNNNYHTPSSSSHNPYQSSSSVSSSSSSSNTIYHQSKPSIYGSNHHHHNPNYNHNAGGATNWTSSPSSQLQPVPVPLTSQLSPLEVEKIELFYRSHRAILFVGQCLVNLYITDTELVDGGRLSRPCIADWKLILTGVPVLILNKGDTKSRDKRQIQICIAERGTGFPLWRDVIDSLSCYSASQPTFHTLYLSSDHRKMAGLSFDCPAASAGFYRQIEPIISNPANIGVSGPKTKSVRARLFNGKKRSKSVGRITSNGGGGNDHHSDHTIGTLGLDTLTLSSNHRDISRSQRFLSPPNKADISSPCMFQHVTSVNLHNQTQFSSVLGTSRNSNNNDHDDAQVPGTDKVQSSAPTVKQHSTPPPTPPKKIAHRLSSLSNDSKDRHHHHRDHLDHHHRDHHHHRMTQSSSPIDCAASSSSSSSSSSGVTGSGGTPVYSTPEPIDLPSSNHHQEPSTNEDDGDGSGGSSGSSGDSNSARQILTKTRNPNHHHQKQKQSNNSSSSISTLSY